MKILRSMSGLLLLAGVVLATVRCGGLSSTCQKALDCCTTVQKAEGQSGDQAKVSCKTAGGLDTSITADCTKVRTMDSAGGTLGAAGCASLTSSLVSILETCKKDVPAVCK